MPNNTLHSKVWPRNVGQAELPINATDTFGDALSPSPIRATPTSEIPHAEWRESSLVTQESNPPTWTYSSSTQRPLLSKRSKHPKVALMMAPTSCNHRPMRRTSAVHDAPREGEGSDTRTHVSTSPSLHSKDHGITRHEETSLSETSKPPTSSDYITPQDPWNPSPLSGQPRIHSPTPQTHLEMP